ncbi:MAG TPA: HlyD family secretion protein [Alphaproteobacteria bacterium]|nr:HlyD family secretion protein [Alphaproteobacteria bacterium]
MHATTHNNNIARADSSRLLEIPPGRADSRGPFETDAQTDLVALKQNRKLSRKKVALVTLIVIAGLSVLTFARYWWTTGRFIQSTDDAYVGGDVTVIAPKVDGFIARLAVTDNQQVHAGDLLIKLDDRDYRAALAKAVATVETQRATLTNLDAQRHLQEAVIAQAQADIAAADAEVVRAGDDEARYKSMAAKGATSVESFEKADADYKKAIADGQKCRAALTAAQRELDVIATQKEQTQAALDAAIAGRDMAELNLSYTELRAPIDGTVGNRSAQLGAYATVGTQLIALVPSHGLWIDANFKENQLAHIRPGAPVTVEIDLLGENNFHGHVVSIAPATGAQFSVLPPENATGNFTKIVQRVPVRIMLDDESATLGQLRPGLSVTAKVNTRDSGS